MRRAVIWFCLLAVVITLLRMAVSPPHYLIVYPNQGGDRAILSVNGSQPRNMLGFGGAYFARIDESEGGAVVHIFQSANSVARCNLDYFTHFEIQPVLLSGNACANLGKRRVDETR